MYDCVGCDVQDPGVPPIWLQGWQHGVVSQSKTLNFCFKPLCNQLYAIHKGQSLMTQTSPVSSIVSALLPWQPIFQHTDFRAIFKLQQEKRKQSKKPGGHRDPVSECFPGRKMKGCVMSTFWEVALVVQVEQDQWWGPCWSPRTRHQKSSRIET